MPRGKKFTAEQTIGKLRDELLGRELFDTLLEAKVLIERWRTGYNTVRPHSFLVVRGKSHPWPFSTWATPENAEGSRGCRSPHPAAADYFHSLPGYRSWGQVRWPRRCDTLRRC